MYFHYFLIISPWKRGGGGPSFKQTWIPITLECFVLSLVEIGPVILKNTILKFVNVFWLFRYYLPLEKGVALHLNKYESPLPKDALCQVWLKLAQWFLSKIWKCEKFTDRRREGQTDIRWSEKLTNWAFSSVS